MLKFRNKKFLIKEASYDGEYETLCFECIRITGNKNKPKESLATYPLLDKNGKVIGESVDVVKRAGYSEEEIKKYINYYKKYHRVYGEDKTSKEVKTNCSQKSNFNKTSSTNNMNWQEKMNNCKSLNELSCLCDEMYSVYNINPYLYEDTINRLVQKLFVKNPYFYKIQYSDGSEDNINLMYRMKFVYQACQMENTIFKSSNILDKEKYMKDAFDFMLFKVYAEDFSNAKEEKLYIEVYSLFKKYNYGIEALEANYSRYETKDVPEENAPEKIKPFINAYINRLVSFGIKGLINYDNFWAEILLAKETNDLLAFSRARILAKDKEEFEEWYSVKREFLQRDFDENHYFLARRCYYNDAENIDILILSMLYCIQSIKPIDEKKINYFHRNVYDTFGFYGISKEINNLELISETLDEVYFNYNNYYDDNTNKVYKKARKEINEKLVR